jgi:F-type H+-transporting ATPase subunit delta
MKTAKRAQREARQLFRLCLVNGSFDERRARLVAERLAAGGRSGALAVLSRFTRLLRLNRADHTARVTSAAPLADDVRARIVAGVADRWGPNVTTQFTEDPGLIAGVRVAVGSDVYDGSVRAGLDALDEKFRTPFAS